MTFTRKPKKLRSSARVCDCGEHCWNNLTRGFVAFADPEDLQTLNKNWYAFPGGNGWYAVRTVISSDRTKKLVRLHNEIIPPRDGDFVDHKNRDTFNNRKRNLRHATRAQNMQNRCKRRDSKQPYKGVWKNTKGFSARISQNGKIHYLGTFPTAEAAYAAYCEAGQRLHGEFFHAG